MKEHAGCTSEIIREAYQYRGTLQFIFLKQREIQDNVVHVIIQHTANHKRDGDSRKYMTNALGDKVRQISPMFQFYAKIFFFAFTAFKHSSCISSFVFFLDLI